MTSVWQIILKIMTVGFLVSFITQVVTMIVTLINILREFAPHFGLPLRLLSAHTLMRRSCHRVVEHRWDVHCDQVVASARCGVGFAGASARLNTVLLRSDHAISPQ